MPGLESLLGCSVVSVNYIEHLISSNKPYKTFANLHNRNVTSNPPVLPGRPWSCLTGCPKLVLPSAVSSITGFKAERHPFLLNPNPTDDNTSDQTSPQKHAQLPDFVRRFIRDGQSNVISISSEEWDTMVAERASLRNLKQIGVIDISQVNDVLSTPVYDL